MMRFLPLAIFLALCLLLAGLLLLRPPQETAIRPATKTLALPLPALPLSPESGEFNHEAFHKPRILVNIFASWCTPCLAEHPLLLALPDDITVYGIAYKDNAQDVKDWLAEHGNPYDKLWLDNSGEIAIELGLRGVPESFVITRDAQIILQYSAPLTTNYIETTLLPLLRHETTAD